MFKEIRDFLGLFGLFCLLYLATNLSWESQHIPQTPTPGWSNGVGKFGQTTLKPATSYANYLLALGSGGLWQQTPVA
ncbi:MAG TPA: hypothetical protein IGS52_20550 [Oscillatoriaceae cyanobacterium M33_DOE_052]|uniref:Uncharacterized protein n=1 Tax=Planktothricoides sp. SpSt-374 TaxID=2282167 RepID=A0A7C3VWC8_9CYAN|nr:hypothetical protein [Oscillatoriaceae cyanobacterium M33_DOE_052]